MKVMSKLGALLLSTIIMLTFSVVGCKEAVPVEEEAEPVEEAETVSVEEAAPVEEEIQVEEEVQAEIVAHYKVAWIPPDMFNPFWNYNRQGMELAADQILREKGYKIDIVPLSPIKVFDVAEQVAIFENAIEMGLDGIIVCPTDQNALIPVTKKAKDAGIPVVALSTDIPTEEVLTYCGVKNIESAALTAEYVISFLPSDAEVVLLSGFAGNLVSEERMKGYRQALDAANIKILDEQPSNFNRVDSMDTMENLMVKYSRIDAAFCVNDEAALGAYEAVASAGREGEIKVVGFDGNKDAIQSIAEEKIFCSLDQGPWRQGTDSLVAIINYLEGKEVPRYSDWLGEVINKENASEKLAKFDEMEIWYKP